MPDDIVFQSQPSQARLRFVGGIVVVLTFFAGAFFTFSYLSQAETVAPAVSPQPAFAPAHLEMFDNLALAAKSAEVYDMSTGETLYEKNADAQLPLASLTKIALALAISDVLPPNAHITLPYSTAWTTNAPVLPAKSTWRAQDLIDYTLIASLNDGADILAEAADEPIRARYPAAPEGKGAVWRMNDLARQLGLTQMYFLNPSGLDESATQSGAYGTAENVARLYAYAASTSASRLSATTRSTLTITSIDGLHATATNTDEALPDIPNLILGKTGYTDLAGGNLAVVFQPEPGRTVVIVVLGSTREGRFDDMRTLVAATQKALQP